MFDEEFSPADKLAVRHCQFQRKAYGFKRDEDGAVVFLFKLGKNLHHLRNAGHLAGIEADGSIWVNESYASTTDPEFSRLPVRR
jgi:hypothetical protein